MLVLGSDARKHKSKGSYLLEFRCDWIMTAGFMYRELEGVRIEVNSADS